MSDIKDTNETAAAENGASAATATAAREPEARAEAEAGSEAAADAERSEGCDAEADGAAQAAHDAVAELRARDVARIQALFGARAHGDAPAVAAEGGFAFARWSRPLAPMFFNVERKSAEIMRQGFERIARTAGVGLAAEEPEFGANVLVYFCEEWSELAAAPQLGRLLPDLPRLLALLEAREAAEYRAFRYSEAEGVTFAVVLLRLDEALGALPPQTLALSQAVQCILLWADGAFADESPVAIGRHGRGVVKRWHQRLIEAAYAEETPAFSRDAALAEVLADRMSAPRQPRPARDDAEARPGSEGDDEAPAFAAVEAAAKAAPVDAAPSQSADAAPSSAAAAETPADDGATWS